MAVKITAFEIENVKRIKAVELAPAADGLTVIGGRNGQGKTSALDAIAWCLGGGRMKPTDARRDGAIADPYMRCELSNGIVAERKGRNGALTVTDPTGAKAGQALLDAFLGEFSLNVPKWLGMGEEERTLSLLGTIGVADELDALDRRQAAAEQERLVLGREAKRLRAAADTLPWHADAPDEPQDVAELLRERSAAEARNAERGALRHAAESASRERSWAEQDARMAEERLASARRELMEATDAKDRADAGVSAAKDAELRARQAAADAGADESTEDIDAMIAGVQTANALCTENMRKAQAAEEADAAEGAYRAAQEAVDGIRAERAALLEGAEMPLEGLGLIDGCLAYMGRRWDCMSGSEQLRVATAIARALRPECGFVLVDKLEQFDAESLAEFGEWAEAQGLQVIGTRVGTDGSCTVVIEDGRVAGMPDAVEAADAARAEAEAAEAAAKWAM